ncbi:MAG: DJ-1/PfpI family protein [Candidatus Aenigmatarchaeota archaeon]|nr:DJ-1/PfpI family protein [Candidatus Aenigmarchaeota archaeon]
MPKAIITLADGFEEIEAISVIDILRRAGINLLVVGTTGNFITGAHGLKVQVDKRLVDIESDIDNFDAIILPGGYPGYENLMKTPSVLKIVEKYGKSGKIVAAICGAPLILAKLGLLKDKKATAYPGFEKNFDRPRDDPVVVDENFITSRGPGTAIQFALKIVEIMLGKEKMIKVKSEILA